jgi:hypothetical protein
VTSLNDGVLTLDVDWAPDAIIDSVAALLIERRVKATWFVTHRSPAVERLGRRRDLFELGIHPNMLPGSTHGATEDDVLAHILEIVPGAVAMRTHGLYQSSNFLVKAATEFGVRVDVSLFLPRAPHLQPHRVTWGGASLWRIPYFWEDDVEMFEERPIWTASDNRLAVPGLRVFDFHPVHVALNTDRFERYDTLRKTRPLPDWDAAFVDAHIRGGDGPRRLFIELADALAGRGRVVSELVEHG